MRVRAIAETVGDGSVKEYRIVQTVYALCERRVATQHTNNGGHRRVRVGRSGRGCARSNDGSRRERLGHLRENGRYRNAVAASAAVDTPHQKGATRGDQGGAREEHLLRLIVGEDRNPQRDHEQTECQVQGRRFWTQPRRKGIIDPPLVRSIKSRWVGLP